MIHHVQKSRVARFALGATLSVLLAGASLSAPVSAQTGDSAAGATRSITTPYTGAVFQAGSRCSSTWT